MDSRDLSLQNLLPTFIVPRYAPFEPLQTAGQRILMAGNGAWYEARLAWIYLRLKVSGTLPVRVPYGNVESDLQFQFGKFPLLLVSAFIEIARLKCPNECAAWIVWNENTHKMDLRILEEISVGHSHVNVELPSLADGEHMILDLHSHGHHPAFFSETDNLDDASGIKVCGVVGDLDKETISAEFRICANGMFVELPCII